MVLLETAWDRLGGPARDYSPPPTHHRGKSLEKRSCNRCKKRGHLAHACPERTPPPSDHNTSTKGNMGEAKRPATDNADGDGKPASRAKTTTTERGQTPSTRGSGRGGGRTNGYAGRGRIAYTPKTKMGSHTTQGAVCSHCGNENHTAAQCWKLHPELNPFAARTENANMMKIVDEDLDNNRRWEAEQLARKNGTIEHA